VPGTVCTPPLFIEDLAIFHQRVDSAGTEHVLKAYVNNNLLEQLEF